MNHGTLRTALGIVALFVILTVVNATYQYVNQDYVTETALLSVGSDYERVKGVFVRNEKPVTYEGDGVISYEVSDGGRLGIGSVIAKVYSSENQIEIKQRIAALKSELEVLERISNPGTARTAQPSNISDLFSQTYKEFLYEREQADFDALEDRRTEMLVLLSTYQLVTGKDITTYEPKMERLKAEIKALEQAQEAPLHVIPAEEAAYFVSYADGYEDTLRMDNLEELTIEQLQDVRNNPSNTNGMIGKLIDSYEWVLAAVVDNSEKVYNMGDTVTLKFASTSETVKGEIVMLNSANGAEQTMIGVCCKYLTYDLVQHRTEMVEIIRGEYQGIMVPRSALHFKNITGADGKTETIRGVYVLTGEQPEFRRLTEDAFEGPDYVISKQVADNDYLQLYDSIIVKGIDADGQ